MNPRYFLCFEVNHQVVILEGNRPQHVFVGYFDSKANAAPKLVGGLLIEVVLGKELYEFVFDLHSDLRKRLIELHLILVGVQLVALSEALSIALARVLAVLLHSLCPRVINLVNEKEKSRPSVHVGLSRHKHLILIIDLQDLSVDPDVLHGGEEFLLPLLFDSD